ncbi:c-type cytochrome, methanol metabolism-related [Methylovirgula sp. HY1]|uniref:c-type cytochrome, methanol metabolism-related n=1 Tax=Methylovirgula sp. HY1 TaxID=2822761 RepID=UPI001C5BC12F|nr:c-type cytochrome, methanol metabolism-related [Methylovirgula sp. HY1]QXX73693.1 c-type cytochrome, methanol metabolism-related [Methylovirgula sp. HY1]
MKFALSIIGALALLISVGHSLAFADGSGDPAAVKQTNGEWYDKAGNPTFKIEKDGTVDWYTSVGYLQYGANCMVCHGPDGLGSSYAPNLTNSLKTMSYAEFYGIVVGGKRNVSASQDLVMPAWGTNKNVMCHLDAIFIYLRARSDGALGRGRPNKVGPKPAGFDKAEDQCFGD